ncbi:hypothetical protein C4J81_14735 [Deltaproteobacteria bacterium Smac51]|nr:hypothetical protein C4J81_14735 [Deltaproteobacteria bacterium Smac51]
MIRRIALILAALGLAAALGGCSTPIWGGKPKYITDFNEVALMSGGKGVVMLHATNRGGLIATRWLKIDDPNVRRSFTVFRSNRHRGLDSMKDYDVVTVEPGTYALYSVYSNCEEGLRPSSTEMDEPWRESVATQLGMVSWLRTWKPGDVSTSVGAWGSSGGRAGIGVGIGMSLDGMAGTPSQPVAICNLQSQGVRNGEALLATVTVRPGELVYAGELAIDYGDDGNCDESGNWMTDNQKRSYCGAGWMTVQVTDAYSRLAKPFIDKELGAAAGSRAVVRLAVPGKLVGR